MEILNIIFRLGVVFAIFGFIWGIFQLVYFILRGRGNRTEGETYLIKALKYFFLVEVTFIFTLKEGMININQMIITCLVLLAYFVGKLQNQQKKRMLFQMVMNGEQQTKNSSFNLKAEIGVIVFAIAFFITFMFFPDLANNPLSNWFRLNILGIEKTPIIGFIFKIIGFIFLVNIISKMANAVMFLITGKIRTEPNSDVYNNSKESKDKNDFDDYEEVE